MPCFLPFLKVEDTLIPLFKFQHIDEATFTHGEVNLRKNVNSWM